MFNTEDLYDIVGEQLLNRRGQSFTPEIKMAMMGLPGVVAFGVMKELCSLDDSVEALAEECEALFADLLPKRIQKMPGLDVLLGLLETSGIPKAIATSSHARFATTALEMFDLQPRFEFVLTAESVTQGKPHPEIYLSAAEKHSVDPAEMLVLEDSIHGSNAALAAGATTIGVPSRRVDRAQFGSVYAICDRLDDARVLELIRN
ncbi:Phosphorylated carbohydrates phosphatase [Mariniblastus fucicola]|uniref:Phosphorylated carbohydrates phosphatase n=2 Tax=Mariniblastus fucicola TaxID=980251 RepID=A0A5B9PD27_9BACT|nr:Phosphorylated carbohydrates phosphatase [Mariniblastus fucicola]